jgi:hypothetical protein
VVRIGLVVLVAVGVYLTLTTVTRAGGSPAVPDITVRSQPDGKYFCLTGPRLSCTREVN